MFSFRFLGKTVSPFHADRVWEMGTIPLSRIGQISCHQAPDQTQGTKHITSSCYIVMFVLYETIYFNMNIWIVIWKDVALCVGQILAGQIWEFEIYFVGCIFCLRILWGNIWISERLCVSSAWLGAVSRSAKAERALGSFCPSRPMVIGRFGWHLWGKAAWLGSQG